MAKRSLGILVALSALLTHPALSAGGTIQSIDIAGNVRLERDSILSHLLIKEGDLASDDKIEESLKNLFETGLFADVAITQQGDHLIVKVVENKIINQITFEGNDKLSDEMLKADIGLRPRETYTVGTVQTAAQKIRDLYRLSRRYAATVTPKIIEREQNRVDVVFEIDEGKPTTVDRISFIGNKRFSETRLESIIQTKESRWYRFFTNDDTYDPDRLEYDKELLRRYYLSSGYADFKVVSAVAELSPDTFNFYITFTIEEGARYKFGKVNLTSEVEGLKLEQLQNILTFEKDDWYNNRQVENSIELLAAKISELGHAFVEVQPKLNKDAKNKVVDVTLVVRPGAHVYINRITLEGNDRTNDDVIRRELKVIEGDPYNGAKIAESERRLKNLNYFKKVQITQEKTTELDKTDVKVLVEDQSTGEMMFGGGYSTHDGPLISVKLAEHNLLGRGQDFRAEAMLSKRTKDISLGFTEYHFLNRPLEASADIFRTSTKQDTRGTFTGGYTQQKMGGTLGIGYALATHLMQSWHYTLRKDVVQGAQRNGNKAPSVFLTQQLGTNWVSAVSHDIIYDRRDNRQEPTEGYYVGLGNQFAGLGGTVRYLNNNISAGYYVPLDEDHNWVASLRGKMGIIFGLGRDVRIVDRYTLGGFNLRGFAEAGAGPRDKKTDDALGGLRYYTTTLDLTFPLGLPAEYRVKGTIFADAGSLFHTGDKDPKTASNIISNNQSLRASVGFGFTWGSPLGALGFTIAKDLKSVKGDKKEVFRLNFGTQF